MASQPRWKHAHLDPEPRAELGRQLVESRIEQWWRDFAARAREIDDLFAQRSSWDLPSWMQSTLQGVHPELMWEYGPGVQGGHRLVITPEAQHRLRPLVERILEAAPQLEGWEFYGHRLREEAGMLKPSVSGRTGAELLLTGAAVERGELNRVDLRFSAPKAVLAGNRDLALSQAFVAAETLLGERFLDEWIGAIDVADRLEQPILLPGLADHTDRLVDRIVEGLPAEPYFRRMDDLSWSALKLEPESRPDYPEQTDLVAAITGDIELWKACRDGLFSSRRFSRHEETFCYLKIDGAEGLAGSRFRDRGEIEDALRDALGADGLGGPIGGGTGLRYSYIDLAILETERAVPVIQRVLQTNGIPRRTWIMFFDADLVSEWIRVRPDTPEPPG